MVSKDGSFHPPKNGGSHVLGIDNQHAVANGGHPLVLGRLGLEQHADGRELSARGRALLRSEPPTQTSRIERLQLLVRVPTSAVASGLARGATLPHLDGHLGHDQGVQGVLPKGHDYGPHHRDQFDRVRGLLRLEQSGSGERHRNVVAVVPVMIGRRVRTRGVAQLSGTYAQGAISGLFIGQCTGIAKGPMVPGHEALHAGANCDLDAGHVGVNDDRTQERDLLTSPWRLDHRAAYFARAIGHLTLFRTGLRLARPPSLRLFLLQGLPRLPHGP